VIEKTKLACYTTRIEVPDHFVDFNKMVDISSGSKREIAPIKLTRYSCYLIAKNGDPKKEAIAVLSSENTLRKLKNCLRVWRLNEGLIVRDLPGSKADHSIRYNPQIMIRISFNNVRTLGI